MRSPRKLTELEKESINRLRNEGKNKKEIAKEIGCGTQVIIKYLAEIGDMNKKAGRKKMPISLKIKKDKGIQSKIVERYRWEHAAEKIASRFGLDICEVKEVIKGLHIFEGINKDLTCKSPSENETFSNILSERIIHSNGEYPYLKYRLLKSGTGILCNQIMKEQNGNEITKFDIVIPCMKTIIINTETEENKRNWNMKIGNDDAFSSFLSHIACCDFFFAFQGIETILSSMEERAKSYAEAQMKFGYKLVFPDNLLG